MKSLGTYIRLMTTLCGWSLFVADAQADFTDDLVHLEQRWAEVNYQLKGKTQLAAFTQLIDDAGYAVAEDPHSAEALIWSGIIKSSYADATGRLGAFKAARQAKADLENAIALDPDAMNGTAYANLGALYHKAPRWPLSFGDDRKAEQLFKSALAIAPADIDNNYLYGRFLVEEERYAEARHFLLEAIRAPARPGHALADRGRQNEIRAAVALTAGH